MENTTTPSNSANHGIFVVIGVAVVGLAALYFGTPASEAWPLQCPLFALTGWQCPLCGSQRAIHALMHGHIGQAWHYNPGLWVAAPFLALWTLGAVMPQWNRFRMVAWTSKGWALATMAGMMMVWGVVRNLF